MDKPNKELLQAFIDWFMREYSNFGGKPIAERYEEAFDTFNNDFIDARYDAFQDGWKVQQAKVEELQKRVQFLEQELGGWKGKSIAAMINGMCSQCGKEPLQAIRSDKDGYALLHCFGCGANKYELMGEQALKGEGQ